MAINNNTGHDESDEREERTTERENSHITVENEENSSDYLTMKPVHRARPFLIEDNPETKIIEPGQTRRTND